MFDENTCVMMKCVALGLILGGFCLSGCIGVEYLDDQIVGKKIETSPESLALAIGQSQKAMAVYLNEYGVEEDVTINWTISASAIASVDGEGNVIGKAAGQAFIFAFFQEIVDTIRLTVVGDVTSVATVTIAAGKTVLSSGETEDLSIAIKNILDQPLSGKTPVWKSSNVGVVSVNADGIVTAIANGVSTVTAEVDGVTSNQLVFTVGTSRSGVFVKSGGYDAAGTATLKVDNGNLLLEFSSDFKTSFALGTVIYLSNNNTSGSAVKTNGLEIQQITQSGAHTFNITSKYPSVKLTDYKYVIILCKPATVIFGSAELK